MAYDSASMAFTSAESWNSDSDILFCIPVTWREEFKTKLPQQAEGG